MFEADAADLDSFGDNGNGDFLGRDGADVQTNRHVRPFDAFLRDAFARQMLGNHPNLSLTADHADVARIGIHRPSQDILVLLMAARHDDQIRIPGWDDGLERFLETLGKDRHGFGKALGVGIDGPVIDNSGSKARDRRDL